MKKVFAFLFFTGLAMSTKAVVVDSTSYVSTSNSGGDFTISDVDGSAPLLISSTDYPGVIRAFSDLQQDIFRVTTRLPEMNEDILPSSSAVIIAGTLGMSELIDSLVTQGVVDTTGLTGKWEKFLIQTVADPFPGIDEALFIVGSDKRGTIYGIYDLSEQIGVSPWYFWADTPVQTKDNIYVNSGIHTKGEPAVKYRGIFINDEDPALRGWVVENFSKFNHQFYEHVFELILRLKGNYLWPAMWGKSLFEDDPVSDDVADEYGIVIGTSHHEPMHRAHVDWSRNGTGDWDYVTNEETLQAFWREGITRKGNKEGLVTVGMRGDGDTPLTGASVELLERIVADQRTIIQEVTGKASEETPQVWALYKEVQDYYDQGMTVPDDVTLLFADDNWGNIRRLPDPGAPAREGGYGVYYHFDYVGGPRSYKWLNTNPLPRIWEQMNMAWEHGVETIWIVNVGDIKPMEFPISFFLDMAWAPDDWSADKIDDYTRIWAQQQFGADHAEAIGDFLARYGKFNGRRKPELLDAETYSLVNYQEAEAVSAAYKQLEREVDSVCKLLPAESLDAYFQLVEHPVDACANLHEMYVNLGKNYLYSFQGRASASEYGTKALELFDKDSEITDYYHTQVADGKWNHMMSQSHIGYTSWQAPSSNIKPSVYDITVPGKESMGVAVKNTEGFWPGTDNLVLEFDVYHQQESYIELFNRGKTPYEYSVEVDSSYILISPDEGIISHEQRLSVSIDWGSAPSGIDTIPVNIYGPDEQVATVYVRIINPESPVPGEIDGFIESNGYISMEAHHYSEKNESGQDSWLTIPDFGKTGSGVTTMPTTSSSVTPGGSSPHLSYNTYFFSTGTVTVKVYLSPTINYLARPEGMRYAVSFDEDDPTIVSFNGDTGEGRSNNIIVSTSSHLVSETGLHILKYWMVDPGVVLQKIVIETGTTKYSYLGPPEQSYVVPEELFITAARISAEDAASIELVFSEEIDTLSLNTNDFQISYNDTVNQITGAELPQGNGSLIVIRLEEEFNENQRVTLNYTPGTLTSVNNTTLGEITSYIVQYGEYEDEEDPNDPNIYMEAENGIVGSNWETHSDGFASNATYVMTKPGHEYVESASSDSEDLITLTFKVCDPGQYTFWARANTPSPNDDSFWIKMDNGSWIQWNNIQAGSGWAWDDVAQKFSLDTGYHELTVCMREDGSGLDKICLSKLSVPPLGLGGSYVECDTFINNVDLVETRERSSYIYPNPAGNELYIISNTTFDYITIYNYMGEAVYSNNSFQSMQSVKVDLGSLKSGIYFLTIWNSDTNYYEIHKFIKE